MARSGWVKREGPVRLRNHISLDVVTRVFTARDVDAAIERTGAEGRATQPVADGSDDGLLRDGTGTVLLRFLGGSHPSSAGRDGLDH